MSQNILDFFGIEMDKNLEYTVLGIDNGAGDFSVAQADSLGNINDIFIDNASNKKDATVIFNNTQTNIHDSWIIGKVAVSLSYQENKKTFENYKVIPQSPEADAFYIGQNQHTNFDLMLNSFNTILNKITHTPTFNVNDELYKNNNKDRKYILFVGRPSSKEWEKHDLYYRDQLKDFLSINGIEKDKIEIVMISEAKAALASEVYSNSNIRNSKKIIIILDFGSSTTDAVILQKGKDFLEYSRQIGSGSIESNMLELIMYDDTDDGNILSDIDKISSENNIQKLQKIKKNKALLKEKHSQNSFIPIKTDVPFKFSSEKDFNQFIQYGVSNVRFDLREAKEKFFGEIQNPINENGLYIMRFAKDNNLFKGRVNTIDSEFMDKVIKQMPFFVRSSDLSDEHNPYKMSGIYRSYYDAIEHFLDGLKSMHLQGVNPDDMHVILTGGASEMPFIHDIVKEKLGVNPSQSLNPSYTVSRGLARVGYTEIKKKEEIKNVLQKIDDVLNQENSFLANQICQSFASHVFDERLKKQMYHWTQTPNRSFSDICMNDETFSSNNVGEKQMIKSIWENSTKPKIDSALQEHFKTLLQANDIEYDFNINPDIVDNAYVSDLRVTTTFAPNVLLGTFFNLFSFSRTDYTTEKKLSYYYKVIANKENIISNFKNQENISTFGTEHSKRIIDGFKSELKKDLEVYIESLTPYL